MRHNKEIHMFTRFLDGQTVLITGASTGIGAATARLAGDIGAAVGIHYNKSEKEANKLAEELTRGGVHAETFQADLSTRGEGEKLVNDFLDKFNKLDHLINNAGALIRRAAIEEIDDDLLEQVVAVNFYSAVRVTRAAIPYIRRSKGSIVNITSIAARNGGGPGAGIYAATKGALDTLTRNMAKELAPDARVNAVAPGVIETPFHEKVSTPEQRTRFAESTPLKFNGKPEDIAWAICYLLSPAAQSITGETIDVNGGLFMR